MRVTESRRAMVNELIEKMSAAAEIDGVLPVEVLSACMYMTQSAIAHLVRNSPDHESRMLNQRVCLQAVDALKFAAVTSADSQMVM